ncbi:MAG: GrpB family protein [Candidatus Marinimicrobia bacterium]|nr:GrpB family protein [Candidatus Neomarinimicrobiota bacterium]
MIDIVPYKSDWPDEFQEIAFNLRKGMGELALRIDHIGSTSVPGLSAKDVIDIQISVKKLDTQIITGMTSLGYKQLKRVTRDHCPPGSPDKIEEWEKMLFLPSSGQRRTHIHIRKQGRANQRYALLFRDYLRQHPATAEAYAELKSRLAQHLADPAMYPEVKDPAVDLIYLPAEQWAVDTLWRQGESDA